MARRIVVLGPAGVGSIRTLEVNSMDAGAILASGDWATSLTMYDGPLADATVLRPHPVERPVFERDWHSLKRICYEAREVTLDLPLSLAPWPT
jgi:hypothetical protein